MNINGRLAGKVVAEVLTNGHVLKIRTTTGEEVDIVWLDDNGLPIKGKPAVQQHGVRLLAAGMKDLVHYPGLRTKGQA